MIAPSRGIVDFSAGERDGRVTASPPSTESGKPDGLSHRILPRTLELISRHRGRSGEVRPKQFRQRRRRLHRPRSVRQFDYGDKVNLTEQGIYRLDLAELTGIDAGQIAQSEGAATWLFGIQPL